MAAARIARRRDLVEQRSNGDEARYRNKIANYSKGLPHDARGEVDLEAYATFLAALDGRDPAGFERITLGLGRKLTSPQAGLAFDLEGADSHHLTIPPAPAFASAEIAAEAAELYWMAMLRDVPFAEYSRSPLAAAACDDLSRFSDFRAPREGGRITPATLFRGITPGDVAGPYLSQFLLRDVPFGAHVISGRINVPLAGQDFLTVFDDWLAVQNGRDLHPEVRFDPRPRYMRTLRDLAHWVHVDALYQAYQHACLLLLAWNASLDPGMPLRQSATQIGFAEFGGPHVLSLVTEVATRALKAVWYQKWFVHRRLRPEEFGGRVHVERTLSAGYPIHQELLESAVFERVYDIYGSYLLPQAFPEGSPTHPAYGAGHATVAGACTTILKAFFDESWVIPQPVVPSADGTALERYLGPDLTVGGELDKVAANIGIGRNGAGVHWRTDYTQSIRLGEAVAISVLEEQKGCYNETPTWTLTRFDGTRVTI